jgi:hypothetical protein
MSGTRTLPPIGDQPFVDAQGHLTMYALNYLQRLSGFVGQPAATSSGTPPPTVQEQISELFQTVQTISAQVSVSLPPAQTDAAVAATVRLRALVPPLPPQRHPPAPQPTPPAGIVYLANGARVLDGYGSPQSAVYGYPGDIYLNRNGGSATTLWVKESGVGTDTGWTAK